MKRSVTKAMLGVAAILTGLMITVETSARQVRLNLATSSSVVQADRPQRIFLKVGLDGFALENATQRAPVNVAIVLDKSGSMSGQKMRKAKEAAKMAVGRLRADDIVSVIAYDHSVEVLVPATKASERYEINRRIDRLRASGNTALFAGVSKGANEVRKFIDTRRVSRVILLSDGLANVGPSSPYELADLGVSLIKEGISVTTIGLGTGYNEDLMARLAEASDGNHAFARTAGDLASIFNYEFGDLLSVVAKDVRIRISCGPGIRPIRVLGRKAHIYGQDVVARINQLYASQEKFLMIEVEVPASMDGSTRDVATVRVDYDNTVTRKRESLNSGTQIRFSHSNALVDKSQNDQVVIASIELLSNENNRLAVELRDKGRATEAEQVLEKNVIFLEKKAKKHRSKKLKKLAADNKEDQSEIKAPAKVWNSRRKEMRDRQYQMESQRAW